MQPVPLKVMSLYVVFVIIWIFVLPGYVAYRDRALTNDDVATHLQREALEQWNTYTRSAASDAAATKTAQPFLLGGMATDWLMDIWAISYLGFGVLILAWRGMSKHHIHPLSAVLWGICLDLGFNWSNYVRNFVLNHPEDGRKLYSFVHWDISPLGFLLQEGRILGMMILVSMFVILADSVSRELVRSSNRPFTQPVSLPKLASEALENLEILRIWQFSSLILAVIFVPWTYFYWDHIVSLGDKRFLPSAIGIHLIWFLCWYQATRPLILSLQQWRGMKLNALATEGCDREAIKAIGDIAHSESDWQLITAGIAAVGSIFLPFLKVLR
jgi:hypothetical protein